MATQKKPATASRTPVAKKAAAAKKPAAAKSAARPVAAKKAPAQSAAAPVRPAPPRTRATRAARSDPQAYDPATQLDKLNADPPAPPRRTRGAAARPAVAGLPDDFFASYTGAPLGDAAFAEAAQALGCELAAVRAVAEVESRGAGFDALQRPTILYERHVFSRSCVPKGKHDAAHPDVSFSKPYAPGTYGNTEQQWIKLGKAYGLDPVAALKAPSWGMFQILGENHKACGYAQVADYVRAMTTSPVAHLQAFVAFVRTNATLLKALRERNWAAFARAYNGPNYAQFKYDLKMAAAYAKHAAG